MQKKRVKKLNIRMECDEANKQLQQREKRLPGVC